MLNTCIQYNVAIQAKCTHSHIQYLNNYTHSCTQYIDILYTSAYNTLTYSTHAYNEHACAYNVILYTLVFTADQHTVHTDRWTHTQSLKNTTKSFTEECDILYIIGLQL